MVRKIRLNANALRNFKVNQVLKIEENFYNCLAPGDGFKSNPIINLKDIIIFPA